MHRNAHGGHGVGKLQNRLIGGQQDQHLIHPVLPNPALRPAAVRHNLQCAVRSLRQGLGEDQPRHAVGAVHAPGDFFIEPRDVLRRGNDQQGPAVFRDNALYIIPLIQAPGSVADAEIEHHRVEKIHSGIEAAHFHHEENQGLHREHHGGIAHSGAEFRKSPPLLDLVHGIAQDDGHKIHQGHAQQQQHILRALRQIEVRRDIYIVGSHHGQNHGKHIQQYKIPVFRPRQPRSLVHTAFPSR